MILPRLSGIEITPVVEQIDAKTRTLDRFQILLRNNRVGIDVRTIDGGDNAGESGKFFLDYSCNSRTSTKCPATAAAAAIAGETR